MSDVPVEPAARLGELGAVAPEISVIMPNYNGAHLIGRSIESVLHQSFHRLELLVIDDGSVDDSIHVVGSFQDPRVRLIRQDHEGVCAARNRGIREAQGEYIAFLDSDDTWASTCLEHLLRGLSLEPDAAIAYCGWQNVGLEGAKGKPYIPPDYETPEKLELWIQNCRWPIHAALTRKDAILAVGGFNSDFPTSEDFLLWLQIVTAYKVVLVPEVQAFYFHHSGPRATSNRVRMALNHLGAQQYYLRHNPRASELLGQSKIIELTIGEMLRRGYECYWGGDLESARKIFRQVMKTGYGNASDWKRMLPSLLPFGLHSLMLKKRMAKGKEYVNDEE